MASPTLDELNLLHSGVCQAVSDPKRILIMFALFERPRNVTALANDLGIPQPTVSRHLRVLRQTSLVFTERQGASVVYSLADTRIIDAINTMRKIMVDAMARHAELV